MPFTLKREQIDDLALLSKLPQEGVIELCKAAFEYLMNGVNPTLLTNEKFQTTTKNAIDGKLIQRAVEALVSFLIEATKANLSDSDITNLRKTTNFSADTLEILSQFVKSKRQFVEGSIKSANLRAFRVVNIEWRLETKIASRSLLQQNSIFVTMKLYLHTEPKNENRDLLPDGENNLIHSEERRNRRDILVQTDLSSLQHIIQTLEDALIDSKTRRISNIIDAIH